MLLFPIETEMCEKQSLICLGGGEKKKKQDRGEI